MDAWMDGFERQHWVRSTPGDMLNRFGTLFCEIQSSWWFWCGTETDVLSLVFWYDQPGGCLQSFCLCWTLQGFMTRSIDIFPSVIYSAASHAVYWRFRFLYTTILLYIHTQLYNSHNIVSWEYLGPDCEWPKENYFSLQETWG